MQHRGIRLAGMLALGIAGIGLMAGTSAAAPHQAPTQQGTSCTWQKLSVVTPSSLYFVGAAWDNVNMNAYLNAGLDRADDTKKTVQQIILSNPDITKATAKSATVSGPNQDFWGSAGAFRPKADDSQAFFWGGGEGKGNITTEGQGQKIQQTYKPKTGAWTTATQGSNGIVLGAQAYSPDRDALIDVGGVKQCDFFGPTTADPLDCSDSQNQTVFITFDPATGAMTSVNGPTSGGPGKVFGGTLVYDTMNMSAIYFGGTDDGDSGRGKNTTFVLDLKDPLLSKASWKQLQVSGSLPPARAFHTASYDPVHNWMVVYGGVTNGFFTNNEATVKDTWALDLGAMPSPKWINLQSSVPSEKVGAAGLFDTNHNVNLLMDGRAKYNATLGGTQNVSNAVYQLNCQVVVPMPTSTPIGPTNTPDPNVTATATPMATATNPPPVIGANACPQLVANSSVPPAVIADALANPTNYYGWLMLANPNLPPSQWNTPRHYLSLQSNNVPYNPVTNSVVWKAGCP